MAVMVVWSAYNNKYGIDPVPTYSLVPTSVEDGAGPHGIREDLHVLGVYRDGAWHGGDGRAAFDRLREDAEGRFPDLGVELVRDWSEERWPTWHELVSTCRPDLTTDEVEAWLKCGLTRRDGSIDFSRRRGCWQPGVVDGWLRTVGPFVASLMDGGRFIVPWWSDAGLEESRLALMAVPTPDAYERKDGHLTEWLCHLVFWAVRSADMSLQLLTAWEHRLAGHRPPTTAPLSSWDRLDGVDARRSYFGNSGPAALSEVQRAAVLAAGHRLRLELSGLKEAVTAGARDYRPPGASDVEAVRHAYGTAGLAHESAARLCRELTRTNTPDRQDPRS
jgi:hypothetical protein